MRSKMRFTFYFTVILIRVYGKRFFNYIISKYAIFNTLNEQDKILFLCNKVDPYICKKLGYFVFESFKKRKQKS